MVLVCVYEKTIKCDVLRLAQYKSWLKHFFTFKTLCSEDFVYILCIFHNELNLNLICFRIVGGGIEFNIHKQDFQNKLHFSIRVYLPTIASKIRFFLYKDGNFTVG